jgi:hypothetical protein
VSDSDEAPPEFVDARESLAIRARRRFLKKRQIGQIFQIVVA